MPVLPVNPKRSEEMGADLGMLMRGVVVHDEVNVELFGNTGVQAAQEGETPGAGGGAYIR